eukprot:1731783-Amphidinium_carterae.1
MELHRLVMSINRRVQLNRPCFLGQIDLRKAFPRLNKEKARDFAICSGMTHSPPHRLLHIIFKKQILT